MKEICRPAELVTSKVGAASHTTAVTGEGAGKTWLVDNGETVGEGKAVAEAKLVG